MLSTLKTILIVILLAGWAVAIASLHVVRTPDAVIGIIPKNRLGFADSYVDVRKWTAADAAAHPELLPRLIATDKTHWLKHVGTAPELATILATIPATIPATNRATIRAKNSTTDER